MTQSVLTVKRRKDAAGKLPNGDLHKLYRNNPLITTTFYFFFQNLIYVTTSFGRPGPLQVIQYIQNTWEDINNTTFYEKIKISTYINDNNR